MPTETRFEGDLDHLIKSGRMLLDAMRYECHGETFKERVVKSLGTDNASKYLDGLPNFKAKYQAWYSEYIALIKRVLPDRLKDFLSYYEYPRVRKVITVENYMMRDYLQGFVISSRVDRSAAIPAFTQQLRIVEAARATLKSSLMNLTSILQADLFDSEIDSSRALAKAGFLRAAGAMCGVILEKHLKHTCANHGIRITKKNPTISDFNSALKSNGSISIPQWRQLQHLADIRNLCDHDRGHEPQIPDIDDLLSGTSKVLKTVY